MTPRNIKGGGLRLERGLEGEERSRELTGAGPGKGGTLTRQRRGQEAVEAGPREGEAGPRGNRVRARNSARERGAARR